MTDVTPAHRNIVLFLDGTWNSLWDNTNVWRLKSLCKNDASQLVYYSKGVGTQFGEKIRGGTIGYGIDQEIIDAYEWLLEKYEENDRIFIFGFSRGAYTARSLSGFIAKCGLLGAGTPLSVNQLFDRYKHDSTVRTIHELFRDKDKQGVFTQEEEWMLKYSMPVPIWFIGVWDTVGSLGVPIGDVPEISTSSYKFLETDLRIENTYAFHALALDEHRCNFAPTLWSRPPDSVREPRSLEITEQRWFVGAHANVGGGYRNDLLAQLPLKWILEKAKIHGLNSREIQIDGDPSVAPITDSYANFLDGFYKDLPFTKEYYRVIDAPPLAGVAGSTTINETIDASVFERWRKDPKYRPQNLVNWAAKYKVDLGALTGSILATDPNKEVL